jgi:uncharacterized membrane protein YidH (DUF202 family)
MKPGRFSIRGLMVALAIIGFDLAAMARAIVLGRKVHDVQSYALGFGLVVLVLNLLVFGLYVYFARRADLPRATRLTSTPPPLVMFSLYVVVLAVAILSVLFLTSGRF